MLSIFSINKSLRYSCMNLNMYQRISIITWENNPNLYNKSIKQYYICHITYNKHPLFKLNKYLNYSREIRIQIIAVYKIFLYK